MLNCGGEVASKIGQHRHSTLYLYNKRDLVGRHTVGGVWFSAVDGRPPGRGQDVYRASGSLRKIGNVVICNGVCVCSRALYLPNLYLCECILVALLIALVLLLLLGHVSKRLLGSEVVTLMLLFRGCECCASPLPLLCFLAFVLHIRSAWECHQLKRVRGSSWKSIISWLDELLRSKGMGQPSFKYAHFANQTLPQNQVQQNTTVYSADLLVWMCVCVCASAGNDG